MAVQLATGTLARVMSTIGCSGTSLSLVSVSQPSTRQVIANELEPDHARPVSGYPFGAGQLYGAWPVKPYSHMKSLLRPWSSRIVQSPPSVRIAATAASKGRRFFWPKLLMKSSEFRMWRITRSIWSGACQFARKIAAALSISACFGVSLMKRRISFLQMNLATRGWLARRSSTSRPSFSAGCSG